MPVLTVPRTAPGARAGHPSRSAGAQGGPRGCTVWGQTAQSRVPSLWHLSISIKDSSRGSYECISASWRVACRVTSGSVWHRATGPGPPRPGLVCGTPLASVADTCAHGGRLGTASLEEGGPPQQGPVPGRVGLRPLPRHSAVTPREALRRTPRRGRGHRRVPGLRHRVLLHGHA